MLHPIMRPITSLVQFNVIRNLCLYKFHFFVLFCLINQLRYGNKSVIEVTNGNFTRVDRSNWDDEPLYMTQEELQWKYDAHLPLKMYLPDVWNDTLPLLKLMFGEDSWQFSWSNNYVKDFYATVRNYVEFNNR